jgi:hypothetical protein
VTGCGVERSATCAGTDAGRGQVAATDSVRRACPGRTVKRDPPHGVRTNQVIPRFVDSPLRDGGSLLWLRTATGQFPKPNRSLFPQRHATGNRTCCLPHHSTLSMRPRSQPEIAFTTTTVRALLGATFPRMSAVRELTTIDCARTAPA